MWQAFMSGGASKLKKKMSENTDLNWTAAYAEGLKALQEVPGATKGQGTIVDALKGGMEYMKTLD